MKRKLQAVEAIVVEYYLKKEKSGNCLESNFSSQMLFFNLCPVVVTLLFGISLSLDNGWT